MRPRKTYPASFKAKVALEALREEKTMAELSAQYGVHAVIINRWKKEALSGIEATFSGKIERVDKDHSQELRTLHAKIGELTVERDFLAEASNRLRFGGVKK